MSRSGARPLLIVGIGAAAVMLAVLAVRDSAVRAPRAHPFAALASQWPSNPKVATERLFVAAALAAKANRSLGSDDRASLRAIVRKAPLEPQPFLLEGAVAQIEGDSDRAIRFYRTARLRDPRDPAARLLLADLELRRGEIEQGLSNLVAITRIERSKASPIAPALVEYVQTPGAAAKVRTVFAKNSGLAGDILTQLASNPSNLALIRALAPAVRGATIAPWEERLVESTLAGGEPAKARRLWVSINRIRPTADQVPFNPDFRPIAPRPPFNWEVGSGRAGLAELRPEGGLAIVHFGREPILLARQLVVLEPGRYEIGTELNRPAEPGRLEWRLQCTTGGEPQVIAVGAPGRTVQSSAGCPASWLELHAVPDESEQQMERTVNRVILRKAS